MEEHLATRSGARDAPETEPLPRLPRSAHDEPEREASDTQLRLRPKREPLLVAGETCWRIETADRTSVLIDAADYYSALRHAIAAAQSHVFIIGWDVDSRTRLVPDKRPADGLPATLLRFLKAVLRRRPQLQVYIVAWDFSMIYALEREFLPSYTFSHAHPRLHFLLDGSHAFGASHHQKLVVVDDRLAFVGGIDLTIRRWDRAAHVWNDADRVDPDGQPYAPMHDVQVCVDGHAARALAELARERLSRAAHATRSGTGHRSPLKIPDLLQPNAAPGRDPWPGPQLASVDFIATPIGICRTWARTADHPSDVREIEALTRTALASAQEYIYIENQYLTSSATADALLESLARSVGPEIVVVLPKYECGWLEQSSMGVLRNRVLQRLRTGDPHGRLHLYYPKLPDEAGKSINVHAKLMIIDGRLLKIGSSNLSNRSLGLDTECDVAIEARDGDRGAQRTQRAIECVLQRLLAEHLALSPTQCAAHFAGHGTLLSLIEARAGEARCLEPLPETREPVPFDLAALGGEWVVDPERPMAAETFIQSLFPADLKHPLWRSVGASLAMLAPIFVLAWLCHVHGSGAPGIAPWLQRLPRSPHAGVYVCLSYALAGVVFMPISVLLAATVVLFEPAQAFVYALSGALLAATLSYGIGRTWKDATLRQLRGRHERHLRRGLRVRTFRATILARLLPAGNFTASNLLAGALNLALWPFVLGNLVGLSFGLAWLVLLAFRLAVAFASPNALNIGVASAIATAMLAISYGLARWFVTPKRAREKHAS